MSATLLFSIGLIGGLVTGGLAGAYFHRRACNKVAKSEKEKQDKHKAYTRLLHARTDAMEVKVYLDSIRSGKFAAGLELLERALDVSILHIHSCAGACELETVDRTNALKTLRMIHEYRVRHPRKPEAQFEGDGDDNDWTGTHEKIKNILNETPNVSL